AVGSGEVPGRIGALRRDRDGGGLVVGPYRRAEHHRRDRQRGQRRKLTNPLHTVPLPSRAFVLRQRRCPARAERGDISGAARKVAHLPDSATNAASAGAVSSMCFAITASAAIGSPARSAATIARCSSSALSGFSA